MSVIVNGPFFFGKSIRFENGDTDHVCSFCGEMCTHKSSFSNRYHFIQGNWENRPSEDVSVIPICDQCYHEHDIGDSPNSIVFVKDSRAFSVDSIFRAND